MGFFLTPWHVSDVKQLVVFSQTWSIQETRILSTRSRSSILKSHPWRWLYTCTLFYYYFLTESRAKNGVKSCQETFRTRGTEIQQMVCNAVRLDTELWVKMEVLFHLSFIFSMVEHYLTEPWRNYGMSWRTFDPRKPVCKGTRVS